MCSEAALKGEERVWEVGCKSGGKVRGYDVRVVESRWGGKSECGVRYGGGVCSLKGVDEVSGMGSSAAEGGKVGSNGSGPVRALSFGVEGGRRRFEREDVEGCGIRLGEDGCEFFG